MKTGEATNLIFLDIETWSGEKPSLDSFTADGRLKDPQKVADDILVKQDKAWRAQALNPLIGEVFCIGVAIDDDDPFVIVGNDEQETLEMLDIELNNYTWPKFVSHNGYDFDYRFLFYRGLKYRMKTVVNTFSKKNDNLIDTMKMLDGTSWKTMVSQDNMHKLLFGTSAKGDITGKDVHDLIVNGEGDRVLRYCADDVVKLRNCYRALEALGLHR